MKPSYKVLVNAVFGWSAFAIGFGMHMWMVREGRARFGEFVAVWVFGIAQSLITIIIVWLLAHWLRKYASKLGGLREARARLGADVLSRIFWVAFGVHMVALLGWWRLGWSFDGVLYSGWIVFTLSIAAITVLGSWLILLHSPLKQRGL